MNRIELSDEDMRILKSALTLLKETTYSSTVWEDAKYLLKVIKWPERKKKGR